MSTARTFSESTDAALWIVLGPDDWLGRHQGVCLAVLAAVMLIGGSF